ncbi:hypothetical protein [Paraburkholderia silvatlantica]|uniref:hypothetical protein n=1 Tax=Paraburkholderia silvatlantica TaxID=321895 RepID=UPI003751E21A
MNLYNQGHDTGEAAAEKKAASLTQQVADAYNYLQQLRQSVGDAVSSAAGQFVGKMDADARAKASEPATDLMAQGAANGLAVGVGMGGGKPPAQNPGAVLVDGAGQALAGGTASSSSIAGYDDGYATLSKSPNSDMRDNANASGTYVDPLSNDVKQAEGRLAADHILPQNWIRQQEGFDLLTPAQQSELLNDPMNTQGLPGSFNSSKGAKIPGEWTTIRGNHLIRTTLRLALHKLPH